MSFAISVSILTISGQRHLGIELGFDVCLLSDYHRFRQLDSFGSKNNEDIVSARNQIKLIEIHGNDFFATFALVSNSTH